MTGEITLRGLVLPIGGLKEKTLAAVRAGIREVIIPKLNEKDLADVPDEVKRKLKFSLAENVDDVLAGALDRKKISRTAPKRDRKIRARAAVQQPISFDMKRESDSTVSHQRGEQSRRSASCVHRCGSASLSGELKIPAGAKGVVIFAHGSGSSRHSPRNQFVARVIREAGNGTLLFDLLTEEEGLEDGRHGAPAFRHRPAGAPARRGHALARDATLGARPGHRILWFKHWWRRGAGRGG
jgi:hypothetical protein